MQVTFYEMKNKALENVFYDIKKDSVFGTAKKLRANLSYFDKKRSSIKNIKDWLLYQDVVTLHSPARKSYPRNHYIVYAIDQLWEIDVCDMHSIAEFNDGYKFILSVIDVFSKYAWMKPLKNKTALETAKAFREIISKSGRKPIYVQSDPGKEFKNSTFRSFLKSQGIRQNFPYIQLLQKAAVIERLNRTIKEKMFK